MAAKESMQRAPREERINLRATTRQEQLLRRAAAATDRSVTDFILDSAVTQAERVLADRRWFLLDDERWNEFQRLLDAPIPDMTKTVQLFSRSSPFVDHDANQ